MSFKKTSVKYFALICLAVIFASCAQTYKKKDGMFSFGYEDQKVDDASHNVSFKANAATNVATVKKFLMQRSAELTVESGYQHFTVENYKEEFAEGKFPLISQTIHLYKDGQNPKLSFEAKPILDEAAKEKK